MAKIEKIQEVAIADLIPYERNAKLHPKDQVQMIADSIKSFGFLTPVLIDLQGNIIAGHGRVEAAKLLGMEKVPCVEISHLSEEQRRAYILADNKLTELGGWDMDLVMGELDALKGLDFDISLIGFDDIVIDEIPETVQDDDFDCSVPKEPKSKMGDVYQLGDHRVMCGDSSCITDVEKLMGGRPQNFL